VTFASLNGDLPRVDDDSSERPDAARRSPTKDKSALRTELATTHTRYHRALKDAQQAPDAASRRAALAEARRLAAHASRLQTRINQF
jgi:hypothetical protein